MKTYTSNALPEEIERLSQSEKHDIVLKLLGAKEKGEPTIVEIKHAQTVPLGAATEFVFTSNIDLGPLLNTPVKVVYVGSESAPKQDSYMRQKLKRVYERLRFQEKKTSSARR